MLDKILDRTSEKTILFAIFLMVTMQLFYTLVSDNTYLIRSINQKVYAAERSLHRLEMHHLNKPLSIDQLREESP